MPDKFEEVPVRIIFPMCQNHKDVAEPAQHLAILSRHPTIDDQQIVMFFMTKNQGNHTRFSLKYLQHCSQKQSVNFLADLFVID